MTSSLTTFHPPRLPAAQVAQPRPVYSATSFALSPRCDNRVTRARIRTFSRNSPSSASLNLTHRAAGILQAYYGDT